MAAPDADSPGSNIACNAVASEKSACSVARQNSQAETIRRRHPSNQPPGQSTAGQSTSGQSTGGGSRWGHTAAAGQRGYGATYCSGGGKRGWDPKRGHPSGTHNRDRQRRMAPTNRNSHQVATADWGPRKKGPYNSVHRGHPLGRAFGDCQLGVQPEGAIQQGQPTGDTARGDTACGDTVRGDTDWGDTHPAWSIHQGHTSPSRGVATQ